MNSQDEFSQEFILNSGELFVRFCDFIVCYLKRSVPKADPDKAIEFADELERIADRLGDDTVRYAMNAFFNKQIRIVRDNVEKTCDQIRKNQ